MSVIFLFTTIAVFYFPLVFDLGALDLGGLVALVVFVMRLAVVGTLLAVVGAAVVVSGRVVVSSVVVSSAAVEVSAAVVAEARVLTRRFNPHEASEATARSTAMTAVIFLSISHVPLIYLMISNSSTAVKTPPLHDTLKLPPCISARLLAIDSPSP